ncbi:hypothetical protein BDW42DRAFT_201428 [Aspergillus taichungensis]|uniref:SAC3/GANP/Nin1/mts3/eIF-3 p25 family-domain-containing protein n=1 Tax=Aspergillus taichungensis TaxID=482145 RepID=A0A2J5HRB2_9EURO|nr:hypothetical protein BDW42DRAFT_201428 [Aspergillus taichungensis]
MSARQNPGKWTKSRLKPVADSLEAVGFVSKGDRKLLDHKAQIDYYEKIKDRYVRFGALYKDNLETAWASLPTSASGDATKNPPASVPHGQPGGARGPSASAELSTLLLSLRKLREAVLATASTTPISFSQHVHIFSIRLAIKAKHPPSYFPSLRYLLDKLHSPAHPLAESELKELLSYLILDYACRQEDLVVAFELRARARRQYSFQSQTVDRILSALAHDNWVVFWQVRKEVNSELRSVIDWAADRVRRHALKAVGSAYLSVHVTWITEGCAGDGSWTWEKLVEREKVGWPREGDMVIIKRPKRKPAQNLTPIKEP